MNEYQRIIEEELKFKREDAKRNGLYAYDVKYDAGYNVSTNEWLESACDDPDCKYCKDRPEKHI